MTRDFVKAFLLGQKHAGKTSDEAKTGFQNWLNDASNTVVSPEDKEKICADIDSYGI